MFPRNQHHAPQRRRSVKREVYKPERTDVVRIERKSVTRRDALRLALEEQDVRL
jgi:hypothetical protein